MTSEVGVKHQFYQSKRGKWYSTIFLHLLPKFCRHSLPLLMLSLPPSQATRLDVVLGFYLLPSGFHSHQDSKDLFSDGVKHQRSTCRESGIEVEAGVETFQPSKTHLPGIMFWTKEQSIF